VDLDGDGYHDILSGSYSRMTQEMAGLFQVLHGQADGTYRRAEVLKGTDDEPLIIPRKGREITENICTRPFAIDWDSDGHLDVVVGNFAGTFYLFKGQGRGRFGSKPEEIQTGDQPLKIDGYHGDPFPVDWDGDGDLDLLSGSSEGGVQWAENRAGPGKAPRLQPFQWLVPQARPQEIGHVLREEDLKGPQHDTRIWVDDINVDGKLDILVGDDVTLVSPADGLNEREFKIRFAAWTKSVREAAQKLEAANQDEKSQESARERYQNVYDQREEFMKVDMTGFVWLYLRK
jgi:hypothetical protein